MRKILAGLTAVALLSLSACGEPTEGTVTDKVFKDAWTEQVEIMEEECTTEWETKRVKVGSKYTTKRVKDTDCEEVGTGEYEDVEHPAEYIVIFENEEGDEGDDKVSEEEYNSIEIGDYYKEQ